MGRILLHNQTTFYSATHICYSRKILEDENLCACYDFKVKN
jgi:hypothetical protein